MGRYVLLILLYFCEIFLTFYVRQLIHDVLVVSYSVERSTKPAQVLFSMKIKKKTVRSLHWCGCHLDFSKFHFCSDTIATCFHDPLRVIVTHLNFTSELHLLTRLADTYTLCIKTTVLTMSCLRCREIVEYLFVKPPAMRFQPQGLYEAYLEAKSD